MSILISQVLDLDRGPELKRRELSWVNFRLSLIRQLAALSGLRSGCPKSCIVAPPPFRLARKEGMHYTKRSRFVVTLKTRCHRTRTLLAHSRTGMCYSRTKTDDAQLVSILMSNGSPPMFSNNPPILRQDERPTNGAGADRVFVVAQQGQVDCRPAACKASPGIR
jgi:hypothetical protein